MPSDKSPLSFTIERILADAAADPEFRRELLEHRLAACGRRDYVLTETEQAVLSSVPAEQLATMIDNVAGRPIPGEQERYVCTGVRPDAPVSSHGVRPDVPIESPIVKGIRPGRVVLAAAAGVAIAGAGSMFLMVTGSRPDPPPVASPVEKKAEDEAGDGGKPPPVDAGKKDAGSDGAP